MIRKTKMKIIINISAIFIILTSFKAVAYETDTHKAINEYIAHKTIDDFSLDAYLKYYLVFENGIEKNLESYKKRRVFQWLGEGGKLEDNQLRFINHFHDPITDKSMGTSPLTTARNRREACGNVGHGGTRNPLHIPKG